MDSPQALTHVRWLAVMVAGLSGFPLGALWYGPLFGRAWMEASAVSPAQARQANKARLYGTTLLLNLVIAGSLALLIGSTASAVDGAFAGFVAAATYAATALGITNLFEFRPLRLWAINAGYQVTAFTAMGAILGTWH